MVRARHSVASHKRKKRLLKIAKGQFGDRSKRYREAVRSVKRGLRYATRDRQVKSRLIKRLWVARINAACREEELSYSRFIKGLSEAKVTINRKMLAELAVHSPGAFKKLIKMAKESIPAKSAKPSAKTKAA
ncbi:MAG: 50S ribosomal protein L20 [Candidatus Omnitrophota bacterium]